MESIGTSKRLQAKTPKKNSHLHSANHLLADELSMRFADPKHFGFYLKMAVTYDHNFLRKLAGDILEKKDVTSPGRLFAYLIKKHNESLKLPNGTTNHKTSL